MNEEDTARIEWLATECTMQQLERIWTHSRADDPDSFRAMIDAERKPKR